MAVKVGATLMLAPSIAIAQRADSTRLSVTSCSYRDCALSISPTWNGLAVVRGRDGARVANLGFFLPRDIAPALRGEDAGVAGADSAFAYARRAVTLRRAAAVLTDVGAIVVTAAAMSRAVRADRAGHAEAVGGGLGLAALVVSVPLQFAADGALSRAVWWHNLRYAH
jgi:hypothetical protein